MSGLQHIFLAQCFKNSSVELRVERHFVLHIVKNDMVIHIGNNYSSAGLRNIKFPCIHSG